MSKKECPECNGRGEIQIPSLSVPGGSQWIVCYICEGIGLADESGNYCPACGEPIAPLEEWCLFHRAAARVEQSVLQQASDLCQNSQ